MGISHLMLAAALLASALTGCAAATDGPTTVTIGGDLTFRVEVASTAEQRRTGLSGRQGLAEHTGMLFVYDDAAPRSYWMADMLLAIDLAWIRDGAVLAVETLHPCPDVSSDCPSFASPGPVDAVLEVPAHALADVEPGAEVVIAGR